MIQARFAKFRSQTCIANAARFLWAMLVLTILGDFIWFDANGKRVRSWLEPQPILSSAALMLGVILLTWQLDTQHRNTLKANRRQAQDRLKLDIFKVIAKQIESTRVPLTELMMVPTAFIGELLVRRHSGAASRYRRDLQTVSTRTSESIIELMATLETYEIAIPYFVIFWQALDKSLDRARLAFNDFALLAMPISGEHVTPMPMANSDELSRLANVTQQTAVDVVGAIWDLRVAAQNYLLGELFP